MSPGHESVWGIGRSGIDEGKKKVCLMETKRGQGCERTKNAKKTNEVDRVAVITEGAKFGIASPAEKRKHATDNKYRLFNPSRPPLIARSSLRGKKN